MTQEIINKYFNTGIGEQCIVLFSTSDDRVFIRIEDAEFHVLDMELEDVTIQDWYNNNEEYPEQSIVENVEEEMYPEEYLDTTLHDLEYVGASLALASEHKLTTEIVYSAMMYLKQFPSSLIEECMDAAINEWIK